MVKFSRVPKADCNSFQNLDVNRGSWSNTIDNGILCNQIILLTYSSTNRSMEESSLTGTKWVDFVSQSTITHIESCFFYVRGKLVTKSITMLSHFHCGIRMGFNMPDGT